MSTEYTLEFRDTYIHLQHGPGYEISAENTNEVWDMLAEACRKYNCRRVLEEGDKPTRSMNIMKAFRSGSKAARAIRGLKMACCFYGYKSDHLTDFFKTVAFNRGAQIEFFSDREEALQWLLSD